MLNKIGPKYLLIGLVGLHAACQPQGGPDYPKRGAQAPYTSTPTPTPGNGDVGGTPAPAPGKGGAALAEIKDVQLLDLIERDVAKLNPSEQQKSRYFTLHVASNSGLSGDALEGQRLAFVKILNSISIKPAIMKPTAIDADRIVYRVNLDDIGLSPAAFDQVIADHYPFNRQFLDVGSADSIANEDTDASLRKLLVTDIYLIRMDWFNATAALPILYEKFMAFPNNLSDFENIFLGRRVSAAGLSPEAQANLAQNLIVGGLVDKRIANIVNDDVIRTGFDNSNVSFSNRIVERHEGANGGYYISYDFVKLKLGDNFNGAPADQADLDAHNINKAPLGPIGTNQTNAILEFNHDGGEVIYMLPNGLFGYYLIDAVGNLLDKGPTFVVQQRTGPAEFQLAITNGHSCMSCHNAGLLVQADTILTGVNQNKNQLLAADISRIQRNYQPGEHRRKLDQDNAIYFAAMKEMGVDPFKPDPVDAAFRFYNRPLTRKDVIAELGIAERDFNLLLVDPEFSGTFNPINNETGFLDRATFQAIYPQVVAKFKQEIALVPPEAADFVVNADCQDDDIFQMDTCIIVPQSALLHNNKVKK